MLTPNWMKRVALAATIALSTMLTACDKVEPPAPSLVRTPGRGDQTGLTEAAVIVLLLTEQARKNAERAPNQLLQNRTKAVAARSRLTVPHVVPETAVESSNSNRNVDKRAP